MLKLLTFTRSQSSEPRAKAKDLGSRSCPLFIWINYCPYAVSSVMLGHVGRVYELH